METTDRELEPALNSDRREEKKGGGGFFASFLNKLGLGPTPGAAGVAGGAGGIGIGGSASSVGFAGGLLATKAGIVALILAGTTIAAGIGVVGRSALSGPGGTAGSIWNVLPTRSAATSGAPATSAPSAGASSSLDYMAQAARGDALLQEQSASADGAASASADASAPGQIGVPDNSNAPANVGSAKGGAGPKLAKSAGFGSSGGSSGSGGSMSVGGANGARTASNASRVGGMAGMSRNMASAAGGRRALVGQRGAKTSDALKFANRDGKGQLGARNPSMARAGSTFDGATSGIQGSAAGVPAAGSGGVETGARSRFSPNQVLDQREVPPVKKVEEEKDVTAYKWAMWTAIGGLLVGALTLGMLGGMKAEMDTAKQAVLTAVGNPVTFPPAVAALNALITKAKILAGIATAAGALATAMGVIMMTGYDQKMLGMMFMGIGGILTLQAGIKLMKLLSVGSLDPSVTGKEDVTKALDAVSGQFGSAIKAGFGL